jgi:hypothetical protein
MRSLPLRAPFGIKEKRMTQLDQLKEEPAEIYWEAHPGRRYPPVSQKPNAPANIVGHKREGFHLSNPQSNHTSVSKTLGEAGPGESFWTMVFSDIK